MVFHLQILGMAKLDKVKEEIGWIKAIFSIVLVTDLSLIAWLIQHFDDAKPPLVFVCAITIAVVTIVVVWLNRMAYKKIDEMENL